MDPSGVLLTICDVWPDYDRARLSCRTSVPLMNATIRSNGELTIPSQIRLAFHLAEGDEVEFEVAEKRLLPRRMDFVDHDPWYSDTPEWQEEVERALAETEAGKGTCVDSGEVFLEAIRRMPENADV